MLVRCCTALHTCAQRRRGPETCVARHVLPGHAIDAALPLTFSSAESDRVAEYDMKLMDIDSEHLGIPDTSYDAVVKMSSSEYARICRDLSVVGESVKIDVSKDGVGFSSEGEVGAAKLTLKQGAGSAVHANDDDEEEDEESKPKGKKRKAGAASGAEESVPVEIQLQQSVSLTFSLKYLSLFAKAAPLCKGVALHMSNEVPLLVRPLPRRRSAEHTLTLDSCCAQCEFAFEDGHVRFYLAPKLSEVSSSSSRPFPSPPSFSYSLLSRIESLADPCLCRTTSEARFRVSFSPLLTQPGHHHPHMYYLSFSRRFALGHKHLSFTATRAREKDEGLRVRRREKSQRARRRERETGAFDCCTERSAVTGGGGEEDVHQGAGASTPRTLWIPPREAVGGVSSGSLSRSGNREAVDDDDDSHSSALLHLLVVARQLAGRVLCVACIARASASERASGLCESEREVSARRGEARQELHSDSSKSLPPLAMAHPPPYSCGLRHPLSPKGSGRRARRRKHAPRTWSLNETPSAGGGPLRGASLAVAGTCGSAAAAAASTPGTRAAAAAGPVVAPVVGAIAGAPALPPDAAAEASGAAGGARPGCASLGGAGAPGARPAVVGAVDAILS